MDDHVSQLIALFPNVPAKMIRQTYKSNKGNFEATLDSILRVAAEWEGPSKGPSTPQNDAEQLGIESVNESVAGLELLFPGVGKDLVEEAWRLSGDNHELAVDLLLASQEDEALNRSVVDVAEVFGLTRMQVEEEFRRNDNDLERVCTSLMSSSSRYSTMSDTAPLKGTIAFLKAMFPNEDELVLEGLLAEHNDQTDDVVDFLLSLDLLKIFDEELDLADAPSSSSSPTPELEQEILLLCEMFPDIALERIHQTLDEAGWDVNVASVRLSGGSGGGGGGKKVPKSRRWKKLGVDEVFQKVVVGKVPVWNGSNASVVGGPVANSNHLPQKRVSPTLAHRQPPSLPSASASSSSSSSSSASHVFTQDRCNASSPNNNNTNAIKMARIHMENRRKYASLASKAHMTGDAHACAMFSKLALREERFQKLWSNRISNQLTKIDLHGLFVKEALDVVSQVLHSMQTGESVQFITGRGKHSAGGVSKIKVALQERLASAKDLRYQVDLGYITVTKL